MGGPITDLGLTCPESGKFYICEDKPNRFVGCCTIDPCSTKDGLCPDNAVRPASFDPDVYDQILAQQCVDPGFLWYTCRDSSPPFMGCCSQMGCEDSGCPVDKVGVATLSSNAKQAAPFLSSDGSSSTTSSSTTSSSTTSSTSSTVTSTASSVVSTTLSTATTTNTSQSAAPQQSTQTPTDPPSVHKGLDKGAIGGIAVGAVAGVCMLALVAFWALRRRNNNKKPPYAFAVGRSGKDSLTEHRDRTAPSLLGGRGNAAAVEQMAELPPSPRLKSPAISELPATPSQLSISSGTTPAPRHIASLMRSQGFQGSQGPAGRESSISGFSAPTQPASHMKQEQSPLIHQTLFELEDSSSRALMGRRQ